MKWLAVAALAAACSAVGAQDAAKPVRIGVLLSGSPTENDPRLAALGQGFRELGYVGPRTVQLEPRWTDAVQRLPDFARELVAKNVDAIVAQGTPAVQAARRETGRIPIIMTSSGDPVGVGLVATLARPGGNITGHSIFGSVLNEKRLELMKEMFPGIARVAILWNPSNPSVAIQVKDVEPSAKALGLAVVVLGAKDPGEFDAAFQQARKARAEALLVFDDPMFSANRTGLVSLAAKHRMPSMYGLSGIADAGGLVSYGPNLLELFRNSAVYVDKILKGARAGDLPVQQPSRFELVLNMKAAKAMGVTIPRAVLLRADRVIE
jgi:putative ABC transport system substrate-binding protein